MKPEARAIGFNHVALEVGDIEEALAFYGQLFEFGLRSRSAGAQKELQQKGMALE